MYIYFLMTKKHSKKKNLVKCLLKKCLWKAFIIFWIVKSISNKMSIFILLSVLFSFHLDNFKHVSIHFILIKYLICLNFVLLKAISQKYMYFKYISLTTISDTFVKVSKKTLNKLTSLWLLPQIDEKLKIFFNFIPFNFFQIFFFAQIFSLSNTFSKKIILKIHWPLKKLESLKNCTE